MQASSSSVLQDTHSRVYEEFFSRNSIVVSWKFYVPWSPIWFWKRGEKPIAKSASEFRLFVGIQHIEKPELEFGSISYYEIQSNEFKVEQFAYYHTEAEAIKEYLEKTLALKGVRIEILAESARWHCMWFSWTLSSVLCRALVAAWFLADSEKAFECAKQIGNISKYGNSSWINEACTWFGPNGLSVYMPDSGKFLTITENIDQLPFYHGIIFCWMESSTKSIEASNTLPHRDIEKIAESIIDSPELIRFMGGENIPTTQESIYNYLLAEKYSGLRISCLKHIAIIKQLSKERKNSTLEEELFRNISQGIGSAINSIEEEGSFTKTIFQAFKEVSSPVDELFWIFPVYSSNMGWSYAFFIKRTPSALGTIKKLIEKCAEYFPWIRLEHLSKEKNQKQENGLVLEQDLEAWVLWKFRDPNKVTFWTPGKEAIRIYPHEIENSFKEGVLVDMLSRKLFINGEPLNSKDHPSQHTMVQVLSLLLESPTGEINSKELWASSYTKSKSEMSSKILAPFTKLILNRLGKTIKFNCRGNMSEFYIKFEQNWLSVAILRQ